MQSFFVSSGMNEISLWTGFPGSGRFRAALGETVQAMHDGAVVWWLVDSLRRVERVENVLRREAGGFLAGVDILPAGRLAQHVLASSGLEPASLDSDTRVLLLREISAAMKIPELGGEAAGAGWIRQVLELYQRLFDGEAIYDRMNTLYPWMVRLLNTYQRVLDSNQLVDGTQLPVAAIEEIRSPGFRAPDLLVVDRIGPIRKRLIDLVHTLAQHSNRTLALIDWEESGGAALELMSLELETWKKHPDCSLKPFAVKPSVALFTQSLFTATKSWNPDDLAYDPPVPEVQWNTYRTQQEEVQDTARRIAALIRDEGVAPDDISVVTTNLDDYARLFEAVFPLYGLLPDLRLGPPLSGSPVAQLAVQLFEGRAAGWPREAVTEMLLNPCVRFGKLLKSDEEVLALDSFARDARIVSTRGAFEATWLTPLTEHLEYLSNRAGREPVEHRRQRLTRSARKLETLLVEVKQLGELLEALPDPSDVNQATDWLNKLFHHLGVHAWVHADLEQDAAGSREEEALRFIHLTLERVGEALRLAGNPSWPAASFAEQFAFAVGQQRMRPDTALQGGIPVTGPLELRGLRTRRLFFLGLSDDRWPRTPSMDPLDPFAAVWPDKINRLAESRALTWEALFAAPHLTFSAPCLEEDEESDVAPSALLTDLKAAGVQLTPSPSPEAFYATPDVLIKAGEDLGDTAKRQRGQRRIAAARPWLSDAERAQQWAVGALERTRIDLLRNEAALLSPFEGLLGAGGVGELIARRVLAAPFSVTRLDTYAACPMRFLFGHVLGVETLEEVKDEADPTGVGELVHDILAETAQRMRAEDGLTRSLGQHPAEAARTMHRVATDMLTDMPYDNLFWDQVKDSLLLGLLDDSPTPGILKIVLNHEMKKTMAGERIAFTEAGFGDPVIDPEGQWLLEEPLEVSDGERHARVHGRIDRISLHPKKGWRVWDYKLSNYVKTEAFIRKGISFQLPLYLEVVITYLETGVTDDHDIERAAYFKINQKDLTVNEAGKWTKKKHDDFRETLIGNVLAIRDAIRAGRYHHPLEDDKRLCDPGEYNYCPFQAICRKNHDLFAQRQENLQARFLEDAYILPEQRFASREGRS